MVKTPPKTLNPRLNYLRFRPFGPNEILVTSDTGDWHFLSEEDFASLLNGSLDPASEQYKALEQKNFFINDDMLKRAYLKYQSRNAFTRLGPNLHIIITTLRCNYACVYCHASKRPMKAKEFDMSIETAKQVVDFIFTSPNKSLNIEFQGGEPLVNGEVIDFVIDYAREKNKTEKRDLVFSLVSNLSLLEEARLEKLIAEDIYLCTSVDGPEALHNDNRPYKAGSGSYQSTVGWLKRVEEAYGQKGLDPRTHHVDALLTVSRNTLAQGRAVVDEYLALGRNTIHLRPLNPFGFGKKAWKDIGYTTEEFLAFYEDTLNYIIEINRGGKELIERQAAILLTRILSDQDPNYMELRSPCGAAIGQLAYNYDGKIFTCDEARMVSEMGDDIFLLGQAGQDGYQEVIEHPTTKSMAMASCQDAIPYCAWCAFKPYCGTCPVYNYGEQGDIFGRMPDNQRCKLMMGQFTILFKLLKNADEGLKEIFARWTTRRWRDSGFFGPL